MNSEEIYEMIKDKRLSFLKKHQKKDNGVNFFLSPRISLNLYKAKVFFVNDKNIILEYDKFHDIYLLSMLRNINKQIIGLFNDIYREDISTYPFFSEREKTFTIQCFVPKIKDKINVKYINEGVECNFRYPNRNCIIDHCEIEIKNIWLLNGKSGFNVELKSMTFY